MPVQSERSLQIQGIIAFKALDPPPKTDAKAQLNETAKEHPMMRAGHHFPAEKAEAAIMTVYDVLKRSNLTNKEGEEFLEMVEDKYIEKSKDGQYLDLLGLLEDYKLSIKVYSREELMDSETQTLLDKLLESGYQIIGQAISFFAPDEKPSKETIEIDMTKTNFMRLMTKDLNSTVDTIGNTSDISLNTSRMTTDRSEIQDKDRQAKTDAEYERTHQHLKKMARGQSKEGTYLLNKSDDTVHETSIEMTAGGETKARETLKEKDEVIKEEEEKGGVKKTETEKTMDKKVEKVVDQAQAKVNLKEAQNPTNATPEEKVEKIKHEIEKKVEKETEDLAKEDKKQIKKRAKDAIELKTFTLRDTLTSRMNVRSGNSVGGMMGYTLAHIDEYKNVGEFALDAAKSAAVGGAVTGLSQKIPLAGNLITAGVQAYDLINIGDSESLTDKEKWTAAMKSLSQTAVSWGAGMGGFYAGVQVGAALGVFSGPGAFLTGMVGGVIGGLGGGLINRLINDPFKLKTPDIDKKTKLLSKECWQEGHHPNFTWKYPHPNAMSFVMMMTRNDGEEICWLVINIPATKREWKRGEEFGDVLVPYKGHKGHEKGLQFTLVALEQEHIKNPDEMQHHALETAMLKCYLTLDDKKKSKEEPKKEDSKKDVKKEENDDKNKVEKETPKETPKDSEGSKETPREKAERAEERKDQNSDLRKEEKADKH